MTYRPLIFTAICLFSHTVFAGSPANPSLLWAEFQAEPDAFISKHTGKQLTVSGVVADTHISIYLTPVVSLVDKAGDSVKVICVLPRTDAGKLSDFKQGSKVKMTGNFYAAHDKIVIKQCLGEK